ADLDVVVHHALDCDQDFHGYFSPGWLKVRLLTHRANINLIDVRVNFGILCGQLCRHCCGTRNLRIDQTK
ncbi:MAG: hypothetical protein ACOYNF_04340, partial [Rhodoferax sp.]